MPHIHPTALVHPGAAIDPTATIGPYSIIGEQVSIGPETVIEAHVVIDGHTDIGARNHIFPGVTIGLEPQDLKYTGSDSLVKIGDDNTLREYVTVNRATGEGEATIVGNHNLLMAYVHVAHNCVLADQIVIANSVALAGHVEIESRAVIGGVLGVHQFVHIGKMAMLGGMSRIDRDVPPFMMVEGNPSRVRALNQVGLRRAGLMEAEGGQIFQALKKAYRLLYRSNLTLKEALVALEPLLTVEPVHHLHQFLTQSQSSHRRGPTAGR
ncbi:acyl-ACP--UDP-N-acetylglucosamine O-acyltransferase [Prochlorothrix hollandica]|uniref:acyl-ACP--UDP-N-acetylglucosamine O-acyltransferase n=1 Tax=Prochlorothrix hollandica TaxID=1223 RepID=UPI000347A554|nr:acyl-ACP--UDP-N-acetylglucosamine O-acyltransferase [Prochlorothrix hollandica]